jgi:hypothetical protein
VYADDVLGVEEPHRVGQARAVVEAVHAVPLVPEAAHQLGEGRSGPDDSPSGLLYGCGNPNPGCDGTTTWNVSESGLMIFMKSTGEPGQPW